MPHLEPREISRSSTRRVEGVDIGMVAARNYVKDPRRCILANPLIRKLEAFAPLPEADKLLIEEVMREPRIVDAHTDLVREGDGPGNVRLVVEGFACRYKLLADGKRHIMAYLIPGDFCDLHVFILKKMDHAIGTLTPCKVVDIPRQRILALIERPAIAQAFWWAALVDEATLREWLVNIGARSAEERVAHLLCELLLRLREIGLANGDAYEMPITQAELAETMGLSSVHVSRVIRTLREAELITLRGRKLVILDLEKLIRFSGFTSNYLHLDHERGPGASSH